MSELGSTTRRVQTGGRSWGTMNRTHLWRSCNHSRQFSPRTNRCCPAGFSPSAPPCSEVSTLPSALHTSSSSFSICLSRVDMIERVHRQGLHTSSQLNSQLLATPIATSTPPVSLPHFLPACAGGVCVCADLNSGGVAVHRKCMTMVILKKKKERRDYRSTAYAPPHAPLYRSISRSFHQPDTERQTRSHHSSLHGSKWG